MSGLQSTCIVVECACSVASIFVADGQFESPSKETETENEDLPKKCSQTAKESRPVHSPLVLKSGL